MEPSDAKKNSAFQNSAPVGKAYESPTFKIQSQMEKYEQKNPTTQYLLCSFLLAKIPIILFL